MEERELRALGFASLMEVMACARSLIYYALQSHHAIVADERHTLMNHGAQLLQAADGRVEEIGDSFRKSLGDKMHEFNSIASRLLGLLLNECFYAFQTGKLSEGNPVDPVRTWLDTTFRDAVLDDERVMKSAGILKVGRDRGDPVIEAFRRFLADFVKTLVEEG